MSRSEPPSKAWFIHVLEKKLEKFIGEFKSLDLDFDKDSIRRVRVASRRLRTVFLMSEGTQFLPEQKLLRSFLKKTGRTLGELRDIDVQIESLEAVSASCLQKEDQPGIARLLLRLRQRRDLVCKKTEKVIKRMRCNSSCLTVYEELQRLRIRSEMTEGKPDFALLRNCAFETINLQILKVISYSRSIENPMAQEEHHEMRVETKRLRYAMEIFDEVYEGALSVFILRLKEFQSLLGELHDGDVWLQYLSLFINDELGRTVEYYGTSRNFSRIKPGILSLIKFKKESRDQAYQNSNHYWLDLEKESFFYGIKKTLGEWNKRDLHNNFSKINQKNLPVSADGIE